MHQIAPGHVCAAPGDLYPWVARSGARYICDLALNEAVNRYHPSVDVFSKLQSGGFDFLIID